MNSANNTIWFAIAIAVASAAALVACGSGGSAETPAQGVALQGTLSGAVSSATVTAYALGNDGGNGDALGTATTDPTGAFTLTLDQAPAGGVRLVASGGSYLSEADGTRTVQGVAWSAVLPAVGAGGQGELVLSPLSTFVDRRLVALLGATTSLPAALEQADTSVRAVYGIQGSVPIHLLRPDFRAASGPGAIFAWTLGSLEQLAVLLAHSPIDIVRAIGEDFADGRLDGVTVGGGSIHYDATTPAPPELAVGNFLAALAGYLAPTNAATLLARNGVTPDPAAVVELQAGVVSAAPITPGQHGNNSALLVGATLGTGVAPTSELRKTISTAYVTGGLQIVFGQATAIRSTRSSDAMYLVLPVKNVGSTTLCFVKLDGLTYRDAAGVALLSNGLSYVNGSVGKVGPGGIATDTCLAPGETGFVQDIRTEVSYTAVARMDFTLSASSDSVALPQAVLAPQSYAVANVSGWQSLDIAVTNVGSAAASTGGSQFSTWTLLDDLSKPLMWGFAKDGPDYGNLGSGSSATLAGDTVIYDGAGQRLLVLVDFDDAATLAPAAARACSAAAGSVDTYHACMQAGRTERAKTAQRAVERAAGR